MTISDNGTGGLQRDALQFAALCYDHIKAAGGVPEPLVMYDLVAGIDKRAAKNGVSRDTFWSEVKSYLEQWSAKDD